MNISDFERKIRTELFNRGVSLSDYKENDKLLVDGPPRSGKTTSTIHYSLLQAFKTGNNVVYIGRTKKQRRKAIEKLDKHINLPSDEFYRVELKSSTESCVAVDSNSTTHIECPHSDLDSEDRKLVKSYLKEDVRDLSSLRVPLDENDICIAKGKNHATKVANESDKPLFLSLTLSKFKSLMRNDNSLAFDLIRDSFVIFDEFSNLTEFSVRRTDRVDDSILEDLEGWEDIPDKCVYKTMAEKWVERKLANIKSDIPSQTALFLKEYLKNRIEEECYRETHDTTYEGSLESSFFEKLPFNSKDIDTDNVLNKKFKSSSIGRQEIQNSRIISEILSSDTSIGVDLVDGISGDKSINFIVYESLEDSLIESREKILEITDKSSKIALIDATPPTMGENIKHSYLGKYFHPKIDQFHNICFENQNKQKVIVGRGNVGLGRLKKGDGKSLFIKIRKLIKKFEENSYKVVARSKRERKIIIDKVEVSPEDITYARSDDMEGVNINEKHLILTGPPYINMDSDQFRSPSIQKYTPEEVNVRHFRDFDALRQIWQIAGRNMMEEESSVILLNMGRMDDLFAWEWTNELKQIQPEIKGLNHDIQGEILAWSALLRREIPKKHIIADRIFKYLRENPKSTKTDILSSSLGIGSKEEKDETLQTISSQLTCEESDGIEKFSASGKSPLEKMIDQP